MRLFLFWSAFAVLPCLGSSADSPSRPQYLIGISPYLENRVKDDVFRRIVRFLLEDAPLGATVGLYDGWHLRTVARIDIPELSAFRSSRTRATRFREGLGKLKEFLAATHEKPADSPVPLDDALRLPQFLDFVAESIALPEHSLTILLLGNPLYQDPKEPGFSMSDGFFPSDAHLQASRDESVYGLKGDRDSLQDARLYWGYFGDPWLTELHREKITRFWSLYSQLQGAGLAGFSSDLASLFTSFSADHPAGAGRRYKIDPAQSKLEMLRITRDVASADWITRDQVRSASAPPSRSTGPMKIGIRWEGEIDLDLYARPRRGARTLFFEEPRSPDGYYFKDHRSSPGREYEFIEFEMPVSVGEVEASINFYAGDLPSGVSGEVRIEFDSKIYSGRFSIPASHGNKGRYGAGQGLFWSALNIPELLQLEPSPAGF